MRSVRKYYLVNLNLKVKVLDFIQFGGQELVVDTTIFEMWLGSLSTHQGLSIPVK